MATLLDHVGRGEVEGDVAQWQCEEERRQPRSRDSTIALSGSGGVKITCATTSTTSTPLNAAVRTREPSCLHQAPFYPAFRGAAMGGESYGERFRGAQF